MHKTFYSCLFRALTVCVAFSSFMLSLSVYGSASGSLDDASNTKLIQQAKQNEYDLLVQTINQADSPFPINATLNDGSTALLWASYYNNDQAISALLHHGADPKIHNRYQVSPLHLAALNGNAKASTELLAAGADPNHSVAGGETILMTASRTGDVATVKALLAAGANVTATDRTGQTALMWAAAEGNVDALNVLLQAGADANAISDDGFTALFFAARAGYAHTVAKLLNAKVDVNSTIDKEPKNRRWARQGSSALIIAINNGHFELATQLLQAGANPNDLRSGFAPLHYLIEVRRPDLGDNSDSPPEGRGDMGSLAFVDKLVAFGADVNIRVLDAPPANRARVTLKGATPLFMAAKKADQAFIELLVSHGADLHITNADGVTPLMMAAGLGTYAADEEVGSQEEAMALIDYFVEKGADVNTVSTNGETAMHGAAYKNFPKVVHHLVKLGADIDIWNKKNDSGSTPIMIAQGFRPGNYKPSIETEQAFVEVMLEQGVSAPAAPSRSQKKVYLEDI